ARDAFDHYPVVNWLALAAVLGKLPPGWATLLSDAETGALERFNRDRSSKDAAFDASAAADIAVVRALAGRTVGQSRAERKRGVDRIARLYRDAFRRTQAPRRQRQSATDPLESLGVLFKKTGRPATARRQMSEALEEIRKLLP